MKYTIGTFSELVGLTPDTLRLYEQHQIVNPIKDDKNNYRYYDDLDVRNLLICRFYRSLDLSLKQAVDLTLNGKLEGIAHTLATQKSALLEERQRLDRLIDALTQITDDIESIHGQTDPAFEIIEAPAIYRLQQTTGNTLLNTAEIQMRVSDWMQALPSVIYSFRTTYPVTDAIDWGMAIEASHFNALGLIADASVAYIPACKAVRCFCFSNPDEPFHEAAIDALVDYAKKNELVPSGDVWGKIVVNSKAMGSYMEVYLLVYEKV